MNTPLVNKLVTPMQNQNIYSPAWKALEEHYSSQSEQDQFKSWSRFKAMASDTKDSLGKLVSVDPSFIFKFVAWKFSPEVSQHATESEQSLFKNSLPPFFRAVGTVLDVMKLKKTLSAPLPGEKAASTLIKGVDITHVVGDALAIAGHCMACCSPGTVSKLLINAGYLSDLLSIAIHGKDYLIAKEEIPPQSDCSGSPPDSNAPPDSNGGTGRYFSNTTT